MRIGPTPRVPQRFEQKEEQIYRDLVRSWIVGALGKDEIPNYPPTPIASQVGTNATLSIPNGATATLLAFNTPTLQFPNNFGFNAARIKALITMTAKCEWRIRHNAGSAATVNSVRIQMFKNNALFDQVYYNNLLNDQIWDLSGFFMLSLVKDDEIDLRMIHSHGSALSVDMTKSYFMLTQVTANMTYQDTSRWT